MLVLGLTLILLFDGLGDITWPELGLEEAIDSRLQYFYNQKDGDQ